MKHLIVFIALAIAANTFAQKRAIIKESGKEVELNDDGTWKFVFDDPSGSIKVDTIIVNKPKTSNFFIDGAPFSYGLWINKNKWAYTISKEDDITPIQYTFKMKNEDAYGMIITEKIEFPLDNLADIALKNAEKAAPDVKLEHKEIRKVNGNIVLYMQFSGTISGIKFVYLGYYFSGASGTYQLLTYTSQNLLPQYRKEMENLLNGFVIKK